MPVTPQRRQECGLAGRAFGSFFAIWTIVFALIYALIMVAKINHGALLGLCDDGADCRRHVSIWRLTTTVGRATRARDRDWRRAGWIMMMNVWGIIWRDQQEVDRWHQEFAAHGQRFRLRRGAGADAFSGLAERISGCRFRCCF